PIWPNCWLSSLSASRDFFKPSAVARLWASSGLSSLTALVAPARISLRVRGLAMAVGGSVVVLLRGVALAGRLAPVHQLAERHGVHVGRAPVEDEGAVGHRVFYALC